VSLLLVDGLGVAYGRSLVLDGLSFSVAPGEIVALLGTNGAGKSTLLKAISGILPVQAGSITFDGADITGARPNRIVAAGLVQMPGGRATFPGLTVAENLRIGGITVPRAERSDRVAEALDQFPVLAERRVQLAGTLSGGQQQILALARALMSRPKLLMIDELSLGLAPTIVHQLLAKIAELRQQGMSLVIVEQQVDLALDLADRAYFLERGQVRFEGPAGDLRGRTDLLRAVFLTGAAAS
jgi:ABC-type branched-subunit amino acid transport system ATPase component